MKQRLFSCLLLVASLFAAAARADEAVLESMQDYADFATFDAGIILPSQISREIFEAVTFIDTRSEEAFEASHIPGAMHIEWREVFSRFDEIPIDRKVVLYCNTGVLSAQATFGLRVLGMENVLVMQTGFEGWKQDAAFKPQ